MSVFSYYFRLIRCGRIWALCVRVCATTSQSLLEGFAEICPVHLPTTTSPRSSLPSPLRSRHCYPHCYHRRWTYATHRLVRLLNLPLITRPSEIRPSAIKLCCPDPYQRPHRRTQVPPAFIYPPCCHNTSIQLSAVSRACLSSRCRPRPKSTTISSPCQAYSTTPAHGK